MPALPVRGLPALRVVMLLLPVFRRRHSWQPQKRIRRNGAYVYHVVPEAFRRELAKGFHAAIVAKALREHGHLNGELGRLAYLERLPGLRHQRVYSIQSSILAE